MVRTAWVMYAAGAVGVAMTGDWVYGRGRRGVAAWDGIGDQGIFCTGGA